MHILLLYPPQAKAGEPPAGLALLAASLRAAGIGVTCCDLNIEALYHLLGQDCQADDTWSRRAARNRFRHLETLTDPTVYSRPDSYRRAVADLNRFLENQGKRHAIQLSLANYQDPSLSPLNSRDLLRCARDHANTVFARFFAKRMRDLIASHGPTHIGISLNYLSQALPTFSLLGLLQQEYPNITTILGGGLVTTWLQRPGWRNPFGSLIEHLVAGPGEAVLPELLTGTRCVSRQIPDFSDFTGYRYLSPGFILPYATSTGCFWRKCAFCPETSEHNPYRPVPVETASREIRDLVTRHRPVLIHFLDNAISPAMLRRLAASPPGAPWYGFVRFTKELADPAFCMQLKASGCVMLKLGLESGSQRVLDSMHKGIDLLLATRALSALHEAGIATYVYLLFGTTGETLQDAQKTLAFVRDHHRAITYLNLAIFNLPLGSPETAELMVRDFSAGDLSIYTDFTHPAGWNRKEIRHFLDTEFKRDPAIQKILNNDPPHFTSNHAALFSAAAAAALKQ